MTLPSFLVIGAQKSGTTWLARALSQHPEICSPVRKELHFFDRKEIYARGLDWYRSQFSGCADGTQVGDYTPNYLWITEPDDPQTSSLNPNLHELVAEDLPDVKLIAILRDPVQRAVSAYYHHIRRGHVWPWSPIREAGKTYGIVSMGFYHAHLSRWLEKHDRHRLKLLVFELDVLEDPRSAVRDVFSFLGVDPSFEPKSMGSPHNVRPSEVKICLSYFSRRLGRLVDRSLPASRRVHVPGLGVSEEDRQWLVGLYREDSRRLQTLISRELPWSTLS